MAAGGTSASASLSAAADLASTAIQSLSTANTRSGYGGLALAGWCELVSVNGYGLVIGTLAGNAPIVFGPANAERMRINYNGNIGIGLTNPAYALDVNGTVYSSVGFRCNQKGNILLGNAAGPATGVTTADACIQLYMYASNNWAGIGCDVSGGMWFHTNYGTGLYLPVSGGISVNSTAATYNLTMGADSAGKPSTNTWTVISDGRLKRNLRPFLDGLEAVLKLRPTYFEYNEDADET
jgi:hypothetical protein